MKKMFGAILMATFFLLAAAINSYGQDATATTTTKDEKVEVNVNVNHNYNYSRSSGTKTQTKKNSTPQNKGKGLPKGKGTGSRTSHKDSVYVEVKLVDESKTKYQGNTYYPPNDHYVPISTIPGCKIDLLYESDRIPYGQRFEFIEVDSGDCEDVRMYGAISEAPVVIADYPGFHKRRYLSDQIFKPETFTAQAKNNTGYVNTSVTVHPIPPASYPSPDLTRMPPGWQDNNTPNISTECGKKHNHTAVFVVGGITVGIGVAAILYGIASHNTGHGSTGSNGNNGNNGNNNQLHNSQTTNPANPGGP